MFSTKVLINNLILIRYTGIFGTLIANHSYPTQFFLNLELLKNSAKIHVAFFKKGKSQLTGYEVIKKEVIKKNWGLIFKFINKSINFT